jgi:RNA recognition motif-containing protein
VEFFVCTREDMERRLTPAVYGSFVQCRGLPFTTTEFELADFFRDYSINPQTDVAIKIHTTGNFAGRPSGDGYIKFANSDLAERAVSTLQNTMMQARYIELFPSTEVEFTEAKTSKDRVGFGGGGKGGGMIGRGHQIQNNYNAPPVRPEAPPGGVRVRLRGLPFNATQGDVAGFLAEFNVRAENVMMETGSDGRPTGQAYLCFAHMWQAEQCMQKDRQMLGGRYIEIYTEINGKAVGKGGGGGNRYSPYGH